MPQELRDSFKTFNEEGLCAYFEKIIDKNKYDDVMHAFAMPPTAEKIRRQSGEHLRFSSKLLFIVIKEDTADIVSMTYLLLLEKPEQSPDLSTAFRHFTRMTRVTSNHNIREAIPDSCM